MGCDPVIDQAASVRRRKIVIGGAHVAQPAETVKLGKKARRRGLHLERRFAFGIEKRTRKRKAAIIDFGRDMRVGHAQIDWRNDEPVWHSARKADSRNPPERQPARKALPGFGDVKSGCAAAIGERKGQALRSRAASPFPMRGIPICKSTDCSLPD